MERDIPDPDALARLAASTDVRDRAFVASLLSIAAITHPDRAALYAVVRETSLREHAALRGAMRDGTWDRKAFWDWVASAPLDMRDHLVEEVLDVAYPPLDDASLPANAIHYTPTGLGEIAFVVEHGRLGPDKTFVDLGVGLGKVASLVGLLTGARVIGVDIDERLVTHGRRAARALGLANVDLHIGDINECPLPEADAYYMYIPTMRSADLVSRLERPMGQRSARLFAQSLDLARLPWLRKTGSASYWLELYETA